MSLEHSPAKATDTATPEANLAYWNTLVDEKAAGDFLDLSARTMQAMRQRGGGPQYVLISARCVRYTRSRLKTWADEKSRSSTSDTTGQEAA